ncbi:sulfite exporter TauE/SafE family protein [Falsibacillus albus]|uniref:Probable membrane transporter protein n=1 Tax=Falsibacillus albus TaxID=2478915 RepID=A0A3L7K1Q2_9BACI|nr:sulfite exporter TauE/SafE family protein [Falsibacillus albus]RLQ96319.1 sulfite exporter TauE/SafE family protein [Falsibacillus albus]
MYIIYFIVGLGASIVGALAGLGGGVIIKPVLDALGQYHVSTITVLSAATVFTMSVVSLLKAQSSGVKVKGKLSLIISIGSVIGGVIGKFLFNHIEVIAEDDNLITVIQAGILAVLMLVIYIFVQYKHKFKTYEIKNHSAIFLVGLILGMLASFLGIGGGPLNVAILTWLFSLEMKEASINSIFIIFFSQLSTLLTIELTTGFGRYDLSMLKFMILGGILGGFIGSSLAHKLRHTHIQKIFTITLLGIILTNLYNMIKFFI